MGNFLNKLRFIPGYRTRTMWKMIVATMWYLIALLAGLPNIFNVIGNLVVSMFIVFLYESIKFKDKKSLKSLGISFLVVAVVSLGYSSNETDITNKAAQSSENSSSKDSEKIIIDTNKTEDAYRAEEKAKLDAKVTLEAKKAEEQNKINTTFTPATITEVTDGDTVKVLVNGEVRKVRLIGVDTPETVHPSKPVEYYGMEASNFTKNSLNGKTVHLQKDISDTDKYGRYLYYIWLNQPTELEPTKEYTKENMFNAKLLINGYAQVSTYPPDVKYNEWFLEFQQAPKSNGEGLWSAPEEQIAQENTQSSTSSPSSQGLIKGNHSSSGELIYHVPGGQFYDRTDAEEYFNTEEEAQAAGYRRSKR